MESILMVVLGALIAWAVEKSADAILVWLMQQLQPKEQHHNHDCEEKSERKQLTPPKT